MTIFWFLFGDTVLGCLFGTPFWMPFWNTFWYTLWYTFFGTPFGTPLHISTSHESIIPVKAGEDFGMEGTKTHHLISKDQIIRTSKRTNGWSNEALSIR